MMVVLLGVIAGFRKGLRAQIPSLIALIFGVVCARLFTMPLAQVIAEVYPVCCGKTEECYVYSNLAAGLIFICVFFVFKFATGLIGKALRRREKTVFDCIAGAVFGVFVYLTILSVSFNFLISVNPGIALTRLAVDGDGNIAGEVSMLSPFLLGTPSPEDLSHLLQLRDAQFISGISSGLDSQESIQNHERFIRGADGPGIG